MIRVKRTWLTSISSVASRFFLAGTLAAVLLPQSTCAVDCFPKDQSNFPKLFYPSNDSSETHAYAMTASDALNAVFMGGHH